MTEKIGKLIEPTGQERRYRIGNESGEVFACDEDFDGYTLTVEVADTADGDALLARLHRPEPPADLEAAIRDSLAVPTILFREPVSDVVARIAIIAEAHAARAVEAERERCESERFTDAEAERERCARIAEAESRRHATEAARYRINDDKAATLEVAHETARVACDRIAAAIREGKG